MRKKQMNGGGFLLNGIAGGNTPTTAVNGGPRMANGHVMPQYTSNDSQSGVHMNINVNPLADLSGTGYGSEEEHHAGQVSDLFYIQNKVNM